MQTWQTNFIFNALPSNELPNIGLHRCWVVTQFGRVRTLKPPELGGQTEVNHGLIPP
jgi:hypothetical protein